MELEAPPLCSQKKTTRCSFMAHPNGTVYVAHALWPRDWLDVLAMQMEGTTSSWVNVVL